jgi:hypothetical protein
LLNIGLQFALMIFISMAKNNRLNVSLIPFLVVLGFFGMYSYIVDPVQETKAVFISGVENNIKIGKLTNNRSLAFGAKNIFQEILQDKDFIIVEDAKSADLIFSAEILYFDVNKTKRNISVFHSDVEETLVVMRGKLTDKSGKKLKEVVAEESSSEISTSTLITDEGSDKVNQQALSSAIKKTCESLIDKAFFNKK